ncbi:MAG: UxaA family hydrolase [Pirellula sp.]
MLHRFLSKNSRQKERHLISAKETKLWIRLHPDDHCIVALRSVPRGTRLEVGGDAGSVTAARDIPAGHKIAVAARREGQEVWKYGWSIGVASADIAPGDHVHDHNLRCEHTLDYEGLASQTPAPPESLQGKTFQGYVRPSGRVGTRNYIAVISTVNCSAGVSRAVAKHFDEEVLRAYPNVDGVVAFTHDSGCGMALDGIKHRTLARVLGGIAKHPNIAAYVLIGLGCEQNTLGHLQKSQRLVTLPGVQWTSPALSRPTHDVPVLSMQDLGGTRATIGRAVELVRELLPQVNAMQRTTVPASEIVLATKCGGSDGYSGITANPALGVAADLLVAHGGTAILSETTELYGAEQLFTKRAQSAEVARKLLDKLQWWRDYTAHYGEDIDNNPSLGNKAGGLTTIIEKSLGAASKGGSTALQEVVEYGEIVQKKGLVIMDAPGFDPVCVTGMVAGGANVVVFTTGRGSCFGCKPVPSIKVATNTPLFERMNDDMDLNMGTVLEDESLPQAGARLLDAILETASGKKTKSECLGYGDDEFTPWSIGPTL